MAVIDHERKRKFKRKFRRHRLETMESVAQADQKIEKLLIRRFDRLVSVRRFTALWILLFVMLFFATFLQTRSLSPHYQALKPVPGGLYNEGLIGTFTNANPLFATGAADAAVSRLVFSGLFKYDNANRLAGDLATEFTLSPNQMVYTVNLRRDVTWQDGKPFNAADVLFTYKTIQNIESQSQLYSSWQSITVTKQDDYTVSFELPNALSAFPYSMTNGIVPAHLLSDIPPEQLRSASFNTAPVGTGPFVLKYIEVSGAEQENRQQRISLAAFSKYWPGKPKLDGISLITFNNDQKAIDAFKEKQLNAISSLESIPSELESDKGIHVYNTPLTTAVMAFFNNSRPNLNDVNIRKALVSAVDRRQLVGLLGSPTQLVNGPLLKGQLGYDPSITQPAYNKDSANQLLDQQGWVRDASGKRMKDAKPLTFGLSAQNTPSYTKVAQFLQKQWAEVGVTLNVSYYESEDLQTSVIGSHSYDILLYGINIGVDPDVFAYWDSTQASLTSQGHLNLSEYKSSVADQAIQSARTRADPALRALRYRNFLSAWTQDVPALALYQPNFLYITRGPVFGYERKANNSSIDRFYNAEAWMIRQQRQTIK